MEPLISVVIPVYNAGAFLPKCLNSILNQSIRDLEIILIDDGSTDNCPAICDAYCKADNRVVVKHTNNMGSSSARNMGLSMCNGSLLTFVDADDWVEQNYLESMVNVMNSTGADMVISSYFRNTEELQIVEPNIFLTMDKEGWISGFLNNRVHAGLWNKLVKKELFEKYRIYFPIRNYYEDMVVSTKLIAVSEKLAYCDVPTYHYRVNTGSFTYDCSSLKRMKSFEDFCVNISEVINVVERENYHKSLKYIDFQVNHNKKKTIKCITDQKDLMKILNFMPNSIRLFNITSFSDALLFVVKKTHSLLPFKLYRLHL